MNYQDLITILKNPHEWEMVKNTNSYRRLWLCKNADLQLLPINTLNTYIKRISAGPYPQNIFMLDNVEDIEISLAQRWDFLKENPAGRICEEDFYEIDNILLLQIPADEFLWKGETAPAAPAEPHLCVCPLEQLMRTGGGCNCGGV